MGTQSKKLITLPRKYEPGFLRRMDRRTEISQRLQLSFDNIVDDLGGVDHLSHIKLSLIERFVFLEALLQRWESIISTKPSVADEFVGKWVQASNAIQGLAAKIGMQRAPSKVLSLKAYVADKKA